LSDGRQGGSIAFWLNGRQIQLLKFIGMVVRRQLPAVKLHDVLLSLSFKLLPQLSEQSGRTVACFAIAALMLMGSVLNRGYASL
jgi:hypothetical protein